MSRPAINMAEAASRGKRRHRRFVLGLVGAFFGVLGLFAFCNTRINPLWVTPSPWTDESFAPFRQIYRNTRTAKAGLLRNKDWEIVLMGSSRVAIAMDPKFPEWGGRKVLNLGLSASTITENKLVVDYVLKHNPSVKHLIVGVDLTDLSSRADSTRSTGFNESPFDPVGGATERELRYVFGVSTFRAAVRTWQTKRKGEIPPYTELGHWAHHRTHGMASVRKMIETGTIPGAKRFVVARKAGGDQPLASKLDLLESILRSCRDHGVKLTVLVPPNHIAYLVVPYVSGAPDPMMMANRRAIGECVKEVNAEIPGSLQAEAWDFDDLHLLNGEALPPFEDPTRELHYWVDGIHSKEPLGHIMLSRMLGWPLPDPAGGDYGVRLDLIDPAEHARRIDAQLARYKEERPDDWAWIEAKIHASDADDKKDDEEE